MDAEVKDLLVKFLSSVKHDVMHISVGSLKDQALETFYANFQNLVNQAINFADGAIYGKEGSKAKVEGALICGQFNVADTENNYVLICGNGTSADALSNAFAISKEGNLVLFNSGTPVVLTPTKLASLIA